MEQKYFNIYKNKVTYKIMQINIELYYEVMGKDI